MNENSNIQNSLFETMKIFSESATAKSKAAVTIEGVITGIQDAAAGIYSVEYFNSTITAHTNSNTTYSVGDNVYILIPEGDFSKEKVILGLITASADAITDTKENSAYYDEITDNLIEVDSGLISLSTYDTVGKFDNRTEISAKSAEVYSSLIKKYLNNYRTFKLGVSVKTDIAADQQNSGNYGIMVCIPVIMRSPVNAEFTQSWKATYLETANFLGTPYSYTDWTRQEIYFDLGDMYDYDDSRLPYYSYYCYDFRQDASKVKEYDIWMKDISLQIVNKVSEEDVNGYHLSIKATEGEYFASYYSSSKTLTPTLKINGKEASLKSAEVYWFIEDASIKAGESGYLNYGGYGWKCINVASNIANNEDGTQTITYISNKITTVVEQADISASTNIKCVVIYKDKTLSAEITLKDLSFSGDIQLTSAKNIKNENGVITLVSNPGNIYIKDTGYVSLSVLTKYSGIMDAEKYKDYIKYSWLRYDKNGNYIDDGTSFFTIVENNKLVTYNNESYYLSTIKFPVNQVEDLNTVYCTAKYINRGTGYETTIGTAKLVVTTTVLSNLNLTINGDNVVYKYDSDGDSPAGTAYDGPTTSKVTSITPLTYSLYKSDGSEFTEDEYRYVKYTWKVPKTTIGMFTLDGITATSEDDNYYYVSGKGHTIYLTYKIANRFSVSKSKEAINLTIEFNGQEISKSAVITFLKEGMSGSNGTAYAAVLVSGGLTATSEESVAYGILNEDGYAQKLKYVYNSKTNKLYRYDFETQKLVDWSTSNKRIFPLVYRDGSLLEYGTHYEIDYSMFDSKVNEPCLAAVKQSDGSCLMNFSTMPSASSCNIVQAKITVKDGNSSAASASQVIYAYYPIELTIISGDSTFVPTFEGGFAEVMYATDGTNPSYDETNLFSVTDVSFDSTDYDKNLLSNFNITWNTSNHLGLYNLSESGYATGKKQSTLSNLNSVKVKPDNKYDDGDSHNYIKATLSFKGNETELKNKRASYNKIQTEKKTEYNNLNTALENARKAVELFNKKAPNWYDITNQVDHLLGQETRIDQTLQLLINEAIPEVVEYTQMGLWIPSATSESLKTFVKGKVIELAEVLKAKAKEAETVLYALDGTSGKQPKNLLDLSSYKLGFDKGDLAQYQALIEGENSQYLSVIKLAFQKVNDAIDDYQAQCKILQNSQFDSFFADYIKIKNDIDSIAELLTGENKTLFQKNKDRLDRGVSSLYIRNVLKDIPNSIPAVFAAVDTQTVELSNAYLNEIITQAAAALNDSDNAGKQVSAIDAILSAKGLSIVHIRPIVFYFNRYSMSNINAWDGNKIETGEENTYLLAPQVGAGIKNKDDSFTGIVMGLRSVTDSSLGTTVQTGLFGYNQGKQSLYMSADTGATILGLAETGGQIIIDPSASAEDSGAIYSSNFFTADGYNKTTGLPKSLSLKSYRSGKGMLINFSEPSIEFGSGNFKVDKDGNLTAGGGGTGTVGGWSITNTALQSANYKEGKSGINLDANNGLIILGDSVGAIYSGKHNSFSNRYADGFHLSSEGLSIGKNLKISADGTIEASAVVISGQIMAGANSTIGGITVGDDGLLTVDRNHVESCNMENLYLYNKQVTWTSVTAMDNLQIETIRYPDDVTVVTGITSATADLTTGEVKVECSTKSFSNGLVAMMRYKYKKRTYTVCGSSESDVAWTSTGNSYSS